MDTSEPEGFASPRGLNIQFGLASPAPESADPSTPGLPPTGPTNFPTGFPPTPSPEDPFKRRKPRPLSAGLVKDLIQIQRELSMLARTENLTLSKSVVPHKQTQESKRRSIISDDSDETCVDDDSTLFDDHHHQDNDNTNQLLTPPQESDELRIFGTEFNLRDAVVRRLAELRERRSIGPDPDARTAFRQLVNDFKLLARALLRSAAHWKPMFMCSALVLVLAYYIFISIQ